MRNDVLYLQDAKSQAAARRKSVIEYAKYIGMDVTGPDRTLLWLAEEGLSAGLPQVDLDCKI